MIQCSQKSQRSRESMTENIRINIMSQSGLKLVWSNDPTISKYQPKEENQGHGILQALKWIRSIEISLKHNDPVIDKNIIVKRIQ